MEVYYYHSYKTSFRKPMDVLKDLRMETISQESHDADFPVNRSTNTVLYAGKFHCHVHLLDYPERGYASGSYFSSDILVGHAMVHLTHGTQKQRLALERLIAERFATIRLTPEQVQKAGIKD